MCTVQFFQHTLYLIEMQKLIKNFNIHGCLNKNKMQHALQLFSEILHSFSIFSVTLELDRQTPVCPDASLKPCQLTGRCCSGETLLICTTDLVH